MVLKCIVQEKEEILKYVRENEIEYRLVDGNAGMKRARESLKKAVVEVIKKIVIIIVKNTCNINMASNGN